MHILYKNTLLNKNKTQKKNTNPPATVYSVENLHINTTTKMYTLVQMQCTLYTTSRTVYTQMQRIADRSWSVSTCILINTHTHTHTPDSRLRKCTHMRKHTDTPREPTSCPATQCRTHSVVVPGLYVTTWITIPYDRVCLFFWKTMQFNRQRQLW